MSASGQYDPCPPRDAVDRIASAIVRIATGDSDTQTYDLKALATADRHEISDAVLRLRDYRFSSLDPAGVAIGMIVQELLARRETDLRGAHKGAR